MLLVPTGERVSRGQRAEIVPCSPGARPELVFLRARSQGMAGTLGIFISLPSEDKGGLFWGHRDAPNPRPDPGLSWTLCRLVQGHH